MSPIGRFGASPLAPVPKRCSGWGIHAAQAWMVLKGRGFTRVYTLLGSCLELSPHRCTSTVQHAPVCAQTV